MQYSILSRFEAALLGAAVGEALGAEYQVSSQMSLAHLWTGVSHQGLSQLSRDSQNCPVLPSWGGIAVAGAQSLIQAGALDLNEWRAKWENIRPELFTGTEAVVATLPVALFFHENEAKRQAQLQQAVASVPNTLQSRDGVLAVGFALTQALKEKLDAATLIPQMIDYLEETLADEVDRAFVSQLGQVQTLLQQRAGLEMAKLMLVRHQEATPNTTPIALALYCFLSTLEDLRLSVIRAARIGRAPQITCAITGALSGAYNSTAGFPVAWRTQSSQPEMDSNTRLWGVGVTEILQLAARLGAAWSGVYQVSEVSLESGRLRAVAAPQVMRLR
ncbi:MAG: ADP-ribosylglycohydrolase family protein [Microcoleus vaginatus WJT46-NPBG5]|jgi:ADP-ribosylglycohydrolase|nr:ADP-ribosylglycohydrolase family protein [Microcoleus vaginatus WJT46-NPBG5]